MAKKINILSAGSAIPFADGGLKLSKSIKISEIENHPDFQSLFKIDDALLERIANSITENGFDSSQPVHIWVKTNDDGSARKYLIDGYTRVAALKKAGHETVPYFEHRFENFEDAYKYVLGLQVNRRNLESGELLRNVAKLAETDFVKNAEGKKSEIIAAALGLGASGRTVEKALSVLKNADAETLAQIEAGTLSVHKAYKKDKRKSNPEPERNASLEESLNVFEDERKLSAGTDDTVDAAEADENPNSITEVSFDIPEHPELYKEGFAAGFKKGASEASYAVYEKLCAFAKEGKTLQEILADDVFSELLQEIARETEKSLRISAASL